MRGERRVAHDSFCFPTFFCLRAKFTYCLKHFINAWLIFQHFPSAFPPTAPEKRIYFSRTRTNIVFIMIDVTQYWVEDVYEHHNSLQRRWETSCGYCFHMLLAIKYLKFALAFIFIAFFANNKWSPIIKSNGDACRLMHVTIAHRGLVQLHYFLLI